MLLTRCQANSMPHQLDAKPTFNSLTFKFLYTNPNQLPGIKSAALIWAISVIVGMWAAHLNNYKAEFINTCQNLLELAKFQTPAISPLVLANLQPQL